MKIILVIEDIQVMRENIAEILELAPYEVIQAANGKEGIALARQFRPDLIICDVMMPELDGFGVLHIIRKDALLAHVPFLFLTAKTELADFRAGMNLGADDYLTKPFDDLMLLNAVELRLLKSVRGRVNDSVALTKLAYLMPALLGEEHALQRLYETHPPVHYSRKHCLFVANSRPTVLYLIKRGKVKIFKCDAAGNDYITALFGPGDFVGYLALLEETAYAETAEAMEDTEVCPIPKEDFLALIYQQPQVAAQVIRMLAGDVAEQQDRLLQLAYQSVRKRVAEALLMMHRKFYAGPNEFGGLSHSEASDFYNSPSNTSSPMNLSRKNLAHLVGASIETVIRVLSDLRTDGLISLSDRQITLLDIKRLAKLRN